MKKALIVYREEQIDIISYLLIETENQLLRFDIQPERVIFSHKEMNRIASDLQRIGADVLISIGMAGFEMSTLLDSFLYNILPAKQLHLLIDEQELHTFTDRQFALNLFVAIPGQDEMKTLIKSTTQIPNLIVHPKYEKKHNVILPTYLNQQIISEIFLQFIKEISDNDNLLM